MDSGFIFHLRTYQNLLLCRESMRGTVLGAFHHSTVAMIEFGHLPPVPMAEAWVIMKTVLATDYQEEVAFLVKVSSLTV
jgi:hypothetical protein